MPSDQIKISLDLVDAAKGHLDFLREVESVGNYLSQPHIISNALYRYENYWLPVLAKNSTRNKQSFFPPLDIHWVWHIHMLSPIHYRNDCTSLIGLVPDHCFLTSANDINKAKKKTKQMWSELFPTVPLDLDFDKVELDTIYPPTLLHISLLGAADQQLEFYYHVSLPHIRRTKFLEKAVKRYEMFLNLKRLNKNEYVVPMYDVDLIWHSHQLCPVAYTKDTVKALGELLDHNDFTTHPVQLSTVNSTVHNTHRLWHEMFHSHLDIPGTGYRGVSTKGKLFKMTGDEVAEFKTEAVKEIIFNVFFKPRGDQPYAVEGKLELEASLISPLKYSYVEKSSPIGISLERRKIGTNGLFSWRLKWKDRWSNNLIHPMVPVSISLTSQNAANSQSETAMTWYGYLNVVSSSPTRISDCKGEWTLTSQAQSEYLPTKFTLLQEGSFHTQRSAQQYGSIWEHVLHPDAGPGGLQFEVADHIIGTDAENTFSVKVAHCLDLKMSIIKVFYKDNLVVVSHSIGAEQLPSLKQIGKRTFNELTLNKQHGERAMLIKNNEGDLAIVIGSWVGLKNDENNKVKEPGNLVIHLFDLMKGTKQHLNVLYPINKMSWKRRTMFEVGDTFVQLKADSLSMKGPCENLAEQVALSFSIFNLFTLCEPRFTDVPDVTRQSSISIGEAKKPGAIKASRLALIRAAGYQADTPSNSYLWWKWFEQRDQVADLPECCQRHSTEITHCPWLPDVSLDAIDTEKMDHVRKFVTKTATERQVSHRYDRAPLTDEESDGESQDRDTLDGQSLETDTLASFGLEESDERGDNWSCSTQL